MDLWSILVMIAVLAVILWLLCKAIFQTYYKEREKFTDRLVAKLKGVKDGKDRG